MQPLKLTPLLMAAALGLLACGPLPVGAASHPSPSPNPYQQALAFSRCMRAHGVTDFPDPSSGSGGSGFTISTGGPGGDLGKAGSTFQSASHACQSLLPTARGGPGKGLTAAERQKLLQYSACMRAHGIPDFPDPNFTGGGASLQIQGGQSSDLDPRSPAFQAAQNACQALLPGHPTTNTANGGSGSGSGPVMQVGG